MKLLCLCYEYPPIGGGGAPACEGLARALVSAGHEVVVVTSWMQHLAALERRGGVEIHRVRCRRRQAHHTTAFELASWSLSALRKARELVATRELDLIHAHFIVPGGFVARRLSRECGLPYVLTAHGTDVPGYNPHRMRALHVLLRPWWRTIVEDASAVTAPSRFLAELVTRASSVEPQVIPNPIDVAIDVPIDRGSPRGRRVLVVSRLLERKGIQHLIELSPQLPDGWEVVVAGDGPYLPHLLQQAERIGAPVRFLGMVPRERLPELYSSAEIFVLPSARENFPMVLLEAMANGCAIVTTLGSGCHEVVGAAARLVRPGRSDELLEALIALIEDPAERIRLRERARQRAAQYSAPVVAARFARLCEGVLGVAEPVGIGHQVEV